jgi:hypothetical protein
MAARLTHVAGVEGGLLKSSSKVSSRPGFSILLIARLIFGLQLRRFGSREFGVADIRRRGNEAAMTFQGC